MRRQCQLVAAASGCSKKGASSIERFAPCENCIDVRKMGAQSDGDNRRELRPTATQGEQVASGTHVHTAGVCGAERGSAAQPVHARQYSGHSARLPASAITAAGHASRDGFAQDLVSGLSQRRAVRRKHAVLPTLSQLHGDHGGVVTAPQKTVVDGVVGSENGDGGWVCGRCWWGSTRPWAARAAGDVERYSGGSGTLDVSNWTNNLS
ncbi:hypothetical protein FGB62_196g02 [Gracilaria domingensis]|nr:hypothetical protein FGB62_196g02 [Gracilaria domingensis]